MIVSAVLVSHDGERWLPQVLAGLRGQTRPADRSVAVDTASQDGSHALLVESLGAACVVEVPSEVGYPRAVAHGLEALPDAAADGDLSDEEWVWLLHDDANPAPDALEQLLAAAAAHPEADVLGPKLREWPSLRRLLELGLTISGTGQRETGLERGEYDQGQHDEVRTVLAVNTAGMLVRRRVLEELGGLDEALPVFGNDIDFGWRAARAGHTTLVVPAAVVFHAEAAHRGLRRTALTGRHTHYQERRAAIWTLLANAPARRVPWQAVRLLVGSMLRALGFLLVRSPGEALDEVAAVGSVCAHPGQVRAARSSRAAGRALGGGGDRDVSGLLAPWWLPYRHGLDFVTDVTAAVTHEASDVAERRRAARLAEEPAAARDRVRRRSDSLDEDEVAYLEDSGAVARFLTNPVAVTLAVVVLLALVAARAGFGAVTGGALAPVPESVGSWWDLHLASWHALGTGTDVPAPAYVLPFAVVATLLGGGPWATGAVISGLMLLSFPLALWGAWRLLRVVGRLADPRGMPRWVLVWGATTYALVPAVSGAWGQGRFGTVAAAALLPWVAHAALGFADPEADRRWRAGWRVGLLLALTAAFVPAAWLLAALLAVLVLVAAALIAPRPVRARSVWGPPAAALLVVPVLLAPWLVPLLATGSAPGLLLEAGKLPLPEVTFPGLLTGRLVETAAPWWLGATLGALGVLALVPRMTRVPVLVCWLVALVAAVVTAALGNVVLELPGTLTRPALGVLVVVLQGAAVVAAVLGADAFLRRLQDHHPWWQRAVAAVLALVAAVVPLGGLAWWLVAPHQLDAAADPVVPAYMEQSSMAGPEHGVLVLRGSVEEGFDHRVRRGDGTTLGEDEVLALAETDPGFTRVVRQLVSSPTPATSTALAGQGVEYVVLPAPADGEVAARLDATDGLVQASAEQPSTRAWQVDRPLDAGTLEGDGTAWLRGVLLALQAVAIVVVAVLTAPRLRGRREDRGRAPREESA